MAKPTHFFAGIALISLICWICFLPFSCGLQNEELYFNHQVSQFIQAISPAMDKFSLKKGKFGNSNGQPLQVDDHLTCIGCVAGLRIVEQLAIKDQQHPSQILGKLCDKLGKGAWHTACKVAVSVFGHLIVSYLDQGFTIDKICQKISMCKPAKGHGACSLYPQNSTNMYFQQKAKIEGKNMARAFIPRLSETEFKAAINALNEHFSSLKDQPKWVPTHDSDGDFFTDEFANRGFAWRGKDCALDDPNIYPGRLNTTSKAGVDYNCNGIKGINPQTGKSYKEELCPRSLGLQGHGVAVIGDSVGARFRLPEFYLKAETISWELISMLSELFENEIDFPHLGWAIGFDETHRDDIVCPGPVDSIYMEARRRNRCSHRDYQNIGVNGATSYSFAEQAAALKRDPLLDNPMTVIVEYVGNDVCQNIHPYPPPFTPVSNFKVNILAGLRVLEKKLPKGSHVVFVGVADGRFLYETLHRRMHPLGTLYDNFYGFLSCLDSNPCEAWLNPNATMRDITTEHGRKLSAVYSEIINEVKFPNFEMHYLPNPVDLLLKDIADSHKDPALFIEPVDGFHPGQLMQPMMAHKWLDVYADLLGPINANNAKIESLFAEQGGY